jgi:hypothetical protein
MLIWSRPTRRATLWRRDAQAEPRPDLPVKNLIVAAGSGSKEEAMFRMIRNLVLMRIVQKFMMRRSRRY